MKRYQNILLAVELESASDNLVIKKAKELRDHFDAKLTLLHAVEHLSNYGAAYGVSAGVDVEEVLQQEAKKGLSKLGEEANVNKASQIVKVGPAKQLILDHALEMEADLIVLGSHGRHGVQLLLGSTANAVLHGAQCDVLAVRVQD